MRDAESVLSEYVRATHPRQYLRDRVHELMADEIIRLREALAAAPRVRVLDRWTILGSDDSIAMNYTLSKEISDAWVAVVDKHFPDSAPHRVVRVVLLDQNDPETPERSTRVTDAMRLALDVLTWQMEARSRCGDPDAECPLQDACKPSHDHTLAIAALTAALEGPRDQ